MPCLRCDPFSHTFGFRHDPSCGCIQQHFLSLSGAASHCGQAVVLQGLMHLGLTLRVSGTAGTGTGWTFSPCTVEAFISALQNALDTFREHSDSFRAVQQRGMERDFTWDKAASQYETIFGWAKMDAPYCK